MLSIGQKACSPGMWKAVVRVLLFGALSSYVIGAGGTARADTWTTPHPGVKHLFKKTNAGGPLEVFGLVVDLCEPGVTPRATAPSEKKRTTSSFGKLIGAQAAINGDFFSYENYMTTGYSVGNGEVWSGTGDSGWQSVVAFGKYHAYFSDDAEVFKAQWWTTEAVSGFAQIMKDGEAITNYSCAGHFCQKHPRTAVGLSRDRRTLYLLVVDGRTDISVGVTLKELASIMKDFGAYDAVNLDGGGSSTMWAQNGGVLNNPSDGSERVVANHLAVFASGSGQPGACGEWPPEQVMIDSALFDAAASTDIDGDGLGDFCARAAAGLLCAMSGKAGLSTVVEGPHPELSDETGWNHPSHYGTIHMGDLDGDTLADVCARGNSGIRCWRSNGSGFDVEPIVGPAWSDEAGWEDEKYYSTIRMMDVDGDGLADLCGRGPDGVDCYRSTGNGFDDGFAGPELSDAQGWGKPEYFGTIRSGDIDGDGRDDLCARGAAGFMCWRSTGNGFSEAVGGPTWNDAGGWSEMRYWETIRLADINGDGRDDLCARGPAGIECYASTAEGFSAAIPGPGLADDNGWHDQTNYLPVRFGDINGDGMADLCARANAGIRCWTSLGDGFGPQLDGPELSDGNGWFAARYYNSIRLADLDGDGMSDLCARTPQGVSCWISDGSGFPTSWTGPTWGDGSGWGNIEYWSTVRMADPRPHDPCKATGACAPGTSELQPCGECGTSVRTCDEMCGWSDWGPCQGGDGIEGGDGGPDGEGLPCDDENECTDDLCGSTGDCTNVPNTAACEVGSLCAKGTCVDGVCLAQEPEDGCCEAHDDCEIPFERCAVDFHVCLPVLCSPCKTNDDCGPAGNLCLTFGAGELACGAWCDAGVAQCPEGFDCMAIPGMPSQCVPEDQTCEAPPGQPEVVEQDISGDGDVVTGEIVGGDALGGDTAGGSGHASGGCSIGPSGNAGAGSSSSPHAILLALAVAVLLWIGHRTGRAQRGHCGGSMSPTGSMSHAGITSPAGRIERAGSTGRVGGSGSGRIGSPPGALRRRGLPGVCGLLLLFWGSFVAGCGSQGSGGADGAVHFEQHSAGDGIEATTQPPAEVLCMDGVGCIGEPCGGPEDCLSGWCIDHLGEQVCTLPCDGTCPPGFVCGPVAVGSPAEMKVCLSLHPTLCRPCNSSFDCLRVDGMLGQCLSFGEEGSFCGAPCGADKPCPDEYECKSATTVEGQVMDECLPLSGECKCTKASADLGLWTACEVTSEAGTCPGKRSCGAGGLSSCLGPVPQFETCNKVDDDCDGKTDEEACSEDLCGKPEACPAGEVQEETESCGPCAVHKRTRSCSQTCEWGPWSEWGICDESGVTCLPGELETETGSCGKCGSNERKRTCTAECVWGEWEAWGPCAGEGPCSPGQSDTASEGCGNCGTHTRSRVCADNCQWGDWGAWGACAGSGPCAPGQTDGGGCDACAQKTCQANCQWGACGLKPGATCLWEEGKNWKCCASGKWHFCLPPVYGCVWSGQCNPCSGCGC